MSYALCGLVVASDLPLPDLLPWTGDDRAPDVEIRLGDVPARLASPVYEGPVLQVAADGTCRYAIADVAAYLVEDGRRVTVRPWMAPEAPDIRVFLLGSVFSILCHQRGLLPLHAGCVEVGGRAVALAGHSCVGKSTLTAAFLRRGHAVLADDVTVVDMNSPGGPLVLPSFPRIKLWRDAMRGLDLPPEGLERSRAQLEKFHVPIKTGFRMEPMALAAVYYLNTVHDPRHAGLKPLRGLAAVEALQDAVYRRGAAYRLGRQAPLMAAAMRLAAAVPGLRLSRVHDLTALDATVTDIAARQGMAG